MVRHLVLLLLLLCNSSANAQIHSTPAANDFVRGSKIIFQDSFKHESPGQFPSRWHLNPCRDATEVDNSEGTAWQIGQEDAHNYLICKDATHKYLEPNIPGTAYLPDSFTIEFDFSLDNRFACAELFFTPRVLHLKDSCHRTGIHIRNESIDLMSFTPVQPELQAKYPSPFNDGLWYHFKLLYRGRHIYCYLDNHYMLSIPDCKFTPLRFSLGCVAPVRYKNVKVTGYHTQPDFNKLLIEHKFTTHAILFDVNKSGIQPGSMNFINQFATWLKENPMVKLEIDGHTDNDGDATANMKLSQARADEVKKQLVAFGVDPVRLTTKGYGASKPIKENNTPEGKAENRRVEFIKQ